MLKNTNGESKVSADRLAYRQHQLPKLLVVCNSLPYFCLHKIDLFEGMEKEVDLLLMAGEAGSVDQMIGNFRFTPLLMNIYEHFAVGDISAFWKLYRAVRTSRPQKVVSFTIKANLLAAAAVWLAALTGTQRPFLIIVNPGLGRVFDSNSSSFFHSIRLTAVKFLYRLLLMKRYSLAVFENSSDSEKWVALGLITGNQVRVIKGTGVAIPQWFSPKPVKPPFRVVFAARLLVSKGVLALVNAARLMEANKSVVFELFGSAPKAEKDAVDLSIMDLPSNLSFFGQVDQETLMTHLAKAHCVCLPSTYGEGLPRILLEGAANQCVLIATDIAGCREVTRHMSTGFLLDPNSKKALDQQIADAISHLAANLDKTIQMGRNARHLVENEGYKIEDVRKQFQSIVMSDLISHGVKSEV